METMIPAGFSYNRKTGEYTDLYLPGTTADLVKFAVRFFGIDKIIADSDAAHNTEHTEKGVQHGKV